MTTLKARYDGKVLVPEEPVDLPLNCVLEILVRPWDPNRPAAPPLAQLAEALQQLPENPTWPEDGAAQLDHYLFGLPKRP